MPYLVFKGGSRANLLACANVWQLKADTTGINSSHIIHRMSFGPVFPGQVNPLDGAHHGSGSLLMQSCTCALHTLA